MSVIIRLQNLPWSANALDIRNFFRGLSIPEGGVHIVGGELGDAFIAFSTDEDARQAMMLDGGKVKEVQVRLLLSSRSEMHKVIETARQTVPIMSLTAPAPAPTPAPPPPIINPFAAALGNATVASLGIPGLGNPLEIPQPAVIEPPAPLSLSPPLIITPNEPEKDEDDRAENKKNKERNRRNKSDSASRSRSRSRDRKDRKRDRRDRSRDRRRRDRSRSRSRERRGERKRDSRRSRSPRRRDRSPMTEAKRSVSSTPAPAPVPGDVTQRLQDLGNKRNPNAFQQPEQNGARFNGGGGRGATRGGRGGARGAAAGAASERGCCVAVRAAPTHTSYGDVRRFFPFMIDMHGIKMINDRLGRRTGNIFVRFCEARSKTLALQRRNNQLKGQDVVVEHLSDDEYDAAVDSFLPYREEHPPASSPPAAAAPAPDPTPAHTVLKLTDLPNFVKEHDIIKAFSDFSLLSIMLLDDRATRSKLAFVQFVKAEDARLAWERRERLAFGRRVPTVAPVSDHEYEVEKCAAAAAAVAPGAPASPPPAPAPPRDPRQRPAPAAPQPQPPAFFPAPAAFPPHAGFPPAGFQPPQFGAFPPAARGGGWPEPEDDALDCVLVKGLPHDATDRTIVEFLADTGAVPARIHLMLEPGGEPSGDCFCEFRSEAEARRAAGKHSALLAGRRVSVDPVPRSVLRAALQPAPPQPPQQALLGDAPPQMQYFDAPRQPFNNQRGGGVNNFRGRGGFNDRQDFNGNGSNGRGGGFDRGRFNSRGRGNFDRGGGGGRGGFDRGRGSFDARGRGGGGRGFSRGRGGFDSGRDFDGGREFDSGLDAGELARDSPDPTLEEFGAPGCVVTMENVPFRATVDEILQFFGEFDLTQDDVIRRFNERGQPTGDARVSFRTPFDAQRACKTHHLDTIHARRIALNIL